MGSTNCGFFTIEQCREIVSGIGGFCVPNQFYNPCGPAFKPQFTNRLKHFSAIIFGDLIGKFNGTLLVVNAAGWCQQALHHASS
jgi:hypothetical protein